jgi:Ataxin-2 C-terminal region
MESEQEIHSTFSKLNVNAVEFVPSFGTVAVKEADPAPEEESAKPVMETPENNGNGELYANCGQECF